MWHELSQMMFHELTKVLKDLHTSTQYRHKIACKRWQWRLYGRFWIRKEFVLLILASKDIHDAVMIITKDYTKVWTIIENFPIIIILQQNQFESLSFCCGLKYAYLTYLRASIMLHIFCRWYNPNRRMERGSKWEVRDIEIRFESIWFSYK